MGQPYVGEIRLFAGNYAPAGWMFCAGQILPIAENETLFNLIGTTYGGDGEQTFALPDMQGRVPVHFGNGIVLAETGGVEEVTLTVQQIPSHNHAMLATTNPAGGTSPSQTQTVAVGQNSTITAYGLDAPQSTLNPASITSSGGSQPHDNMQPFLCVSFIISMFGRFPQP